MHEESRGSDGLQLAFEAIAAFALTIWWVTFFGDAALAWRALVGKP